MCPPSSRGAARLSRGRDPSPLKQDHAPFSGITSGDERLDAAFVGCNFSFPRSEESTVRCPDGNAAVDEPDTDDSRAEPDASHQDTFDIPFDLLAAHQARSITRDELAV